MTNSQRLAAVRRCLDRWLEQQHCDADIDIRDAVLIRGGYYIGRRFELGQFHAVWFMEEDQVKVHDAAGNVLARFDAAAIDLANASQEAVEEAVEEEATIIAMPSLSEPVRQTEIRRAA
jgi:hypothetical protein